MHIVIVTGLSGSGKSEAMNVMEDMGFYCVDNLPPALLPKFVEVCSSSQGALDKVALGIDIRGYKFFKDLNESLRFIYKGLCRKFSAIEFKSLSSCEKFTERS